MTMNKANDLGLGRAMGAWIALSMLLAFFAWACLRFLDYNQTASIITSYSLVSAAIATKILHSHRQAFVWCHILCEIKEKTRDKRSSFRVVSAHKLQKVTVVFANGGQVEESSVIQNYFFSKAYYDDTSKYLNTLGNYEIFAILGGLIATLAAILGAAPSPSGDGASIYLNTKLDWLLNGLSIAFVFSILWWPLIEFRRRNSEFAIQFGAISSSGSIPPPSA